MQELQAARLQVREAAPEPATIEWDHWPVEAVMAVTDPSAAAAAWKTVCLLQRIHAFAERQANVISVGLCMFNSREELAQGIETMRTQATRLGTNVSEQVEHLTQILEQWDSIKDASPWTKDAKRLSMDEQATILRDLTGNPFRPATLDPAWLAWKNGTVVNLARPIYDEEVPSGRLDSGRLAILADALEEAGCTDADILERRPKGGNCRTCGQSYTAA